MLEMIEFFKETFDCDGEQRCHIFWEMVRVQNVIQSKEIPKIILRTIQTLIQLHNINGNKKV